MELSPPANTDIATRQNVERAEERIGARIDAVAADVRATEERLGARIDAVAADVRATEERLGARINAVAAEGRATGERLDARITAEVAGLRTYTWKVVVGTGVALYLATVGTMFGGVGLLLTILERI